MPRVRLSDSALRDLEELLAHWRERSPASAARVGEFLLSRLELLEDHPRLGRPLGQVAANEYRELVVGDVVVRYRVEPDGGVRVGSIRHGRRRQLAPGELEDRLQQEQR